MKDIDKLQKRNRTYRDLTERLGSTGLAVSGLIGLLFLGVLAVSYTHLTLPTKRIV